MLNPKQKRVLTFIRNYYASNGVSPNFSEIGAFFGMSSSASVHAIVVALEREGLITRIPHINRGIRLVSATVERQVAAS